MWVKCPKWREIGFRQEVERNLNVCLKCGHHYRLTVEQRLAVTADRGTWRELHGGLAGGDPLEFRDSKAYPERLPPAPANARRPRAVVGGTRRNRNRPGALRAMDFQLLGGAMGGVGGAQLSPV